MASLNVIDLTSDGHDHLSNLPSELFHIILGYLFADHVPDMVTMEPDGTKTGKATHTFDYLAATCKKLRSDVMAFALHFLRQHGSITKYKPLKDPKLEARRNLLRSQSGVGLLTWARNHCVFCGKKSVRRATLMNGLACCMQCDKEQWPDKITRTQARSEHYLTDEHLLPRESLVVRYRLKSPNVPQIRYGVCFTSNTPTTMFLRKDVERLANLVHGDVRAYIAMRNAQHEARTRKIEANKARRQADFDNGGMDSND